MKLSGRKLDGFEWTAHSNHASLPLQRKTIKHNDVRRLVEQTTGLVKAQNEPAPLCVSVGLEGECFLYLFFADGAFCYHSGNKTHAKWFLRRLGLSN